MVNTNFIIYYTYRHCVSKLYKVQNFYNGFDGIILKSIIFKPTFYFNALDNL